MSTTTTTPLAISGASSRAAPGGVLHAFWTGLRGRMLAAETRRATLELEPRLRNDIGLGPNPVVSPAIAPFADAWMR